MLLAFENQTRQPARHIGSGIDVDPIGQYFWSVGRRMTVNDAFSEIHSAAKKFLSNP